jgi:hypothetical protein
MLLDRFTLCTERFLERCRDGLDFGSNRLQVRLHCLATLCRRITDRSVQFLRSRSNTIERIVAVALGIRSGFVGLLNFSHCRRLPS